MYQKEGHGDAEGDEHMWDAPAWAGYTAESFDGLNQ
jgi:hypothetical protein